MIDIISSRSNAKIRSVRALRQRKGRDESHAYLVEGIHLVGAALESGAAIEAIFYAPDLLTSDYALDLIKQTQSGGLPCYPATPDVFSSLASKEHPQGILAVVQQSRQSLTDLTQENFSWGAACVAPQDPGNIGAILRTIDAVGANGLLMLEGGVDIYHPTAVRASMGAIFRKQVVRAAFDEFSAWAYADGYQVVGSSAQGSKDYQAVKRYRRPLILLLGEERRGLTPTQAEICTSMLRLPMHGKVTSLNLSVAAGVLLYDMLAKMEGVETEY